MAPNLPLDLDGRVALVTGGASGIGAGVCRMLGAAGARVVVCDIDHAGASTVADEIGGVAVRCDVSVLGDSQAAVAAALESFGGLDIAVLNAGRITAMLSTLGLTERALLQACYEKDA